MASSITQITGFAHLTDLPCWQLCFQGATVVVSSYGAHVLHYSSGAHPTPEAVFCSDPKKDSARQHQLESKTSPSITQEEHQDQIANSHLWLSPTSVWQGQQPIRGGVPICWPWFGKITPDLVEKVPANRLASTKLPNHGLVRTRFWQKTADQITDDAVSIEFCIEVSDIPWLDTSVMLRYQVRLDHQLTLTLSCDAVIPQQAALHTYFTVSDSQTVAVHPLPQQYYDKVSDGQCQTNQQTLYFDGEIDRVYPHTKALLNLEDGHRQVQIAQQGHDASVLWNPAAEKAATSADIPAALWSTFVCVESARLSTREAALQLVQKISPQPN
jgi:glucose-6-phosphate 1-epimerase